MLSKPGIPLLILILLAVLSGGCASQAEPIPTPAAPEAGDASIGGRVSAAAQRWRNQTVELYAAPYFDDGSGEGFYLLEPNVHPRTQLQSGGTFGLNDLPPGKYVLVVGPSPEEARLVIDANGEAVIFTFYPDETYPLGELELAP